MIQVLDSNGALKVTGAGGGGGGATGTISAGTTNATLGEVIFSNSNGVTFGMDAGTITASHNGITSQSNQAFSAQGGSSAFQTLIFTNSNGFSFSNTGGSICGSYTVPSTANLISRINVSAGTTSNNLTNFEFSNANGISFGLNGSTITATVKTDYLTTAMASNRGSDFVQANAAFAGTNASGTIASSGISVSVNAQSVVPQNASLYALGNTTQNSSTQLSVNALSFNAIGSITMGYSNGSIQVSAPNALTSQSNQAFSAEGGSSAFQTLVFTNSNGISFSNTNGSIWGSHNALTSQSNQAASASNGSFTFQTLNFSNANNVTFGTSAGGIVTASVAAGGGLTNINVSAGTTSNNLSALTFANANNFSFGLDGSTITGSYTVPTVTNSSFSVQDSATTINPVARIAFSTGNNITLSLSTGASSATVGVSHNLAGTSTGFGGNLISASMTHNSSGLNLSLNHPAWLTTAALSGDTTKYVQAWELTGNTAGTTSSLQGTKIYFEGGNSITVSGTSNTIRFSVGNYLTTAMASNRGSDFVQATAAFNGTNASGTIASNAISVSVASQSNQTLGIYASSNTTMTSSGTIDARSLSFRGIGLASVGYSNNEVLISVPAGAPSPVNFSAGTTSGDLPSVVFSNSNRVSFGLNGSTITAQHALNFSAGTTSQNVSDQIIFSNSNNVTFGLNGSTITASFNPINIGMSNLGGTGGTSGTIDGAGAEYVFVGSNGIQLSQSVNGQSATLSIVPNYVSQYSPPWMHSGMATNSSLGQNTVYFQPFDLPDALYASRINFYVSLSGALSAGNSTGTCYAAIGYGLYSRGVNAADSRTLNLVTSYSMSIIQQSMSSNTQYAATHYIGLSNASSHSTSQFAVSNANASTYQASSVNGLRVVAMPMFSSIMTPGRYWLAFSNSTITGNAMTNGMSVAITSVGVVPEIRPWGTSSAATNASVFRRLQGWGTYSATTNAFPATIAFTTDAIRAPVNQTLIHFDILGYSTSTNMI